MKGNTTKSTVFSRCRWGRTAAVQLRTSCRWLPQFASYKTYTSEFKVKVVIEVLQGEKSLSEIAAQYNLNPNMVRNWKSEFLENASTIFENPKKAEKAARRKEEALKKEKETMLKTIGQLTIERDFLQDCFRRSGRPVPELDPEKR